MYASVHRAEHSQPPARPDPVPRPGLPDEPAASAASAYDFSDVPAIAPEDLAEWLSA